MVTNAINFEVWKSNYIIVYARKGEINAREIVASFKGADGNNIDLSNKSVTFYASKPDKTQIYNICTVDADDDTASIVLTSQMVSVSGIVDCEYQIFAGNELLLKVGGLKLVVEDSCDFSEAIESTSECNALLEAINEAEGFCESIGTLSELNTTEKDTLVGAINEVNGKTIPISNGGTGGTTATAARTNLGVMAEYSIYYNAAGTTGSVSLSSSIADFQIIEIFFWIESISTFKSSVRIYNGGGSSATTSLVLNTGGTASNSIRLRAFAGNIDIADDSITRARQVRAYITGTNATIAEEMTTDTPKIYKVIGYKY